MTQTASDSASMMWTRGMTVLSLTAAFACGSDAPSGSDSRPLVAVQTAALENDEATVGRASNSQADPRAKTEVAEGQSNRASPGYRRAVAQAQREARDAEREALKELKRQRDELPPTGKAAGREALSERVDALSGRIVAREQRLSAVNADKPAN